LLRVSHWALWHSIVGGQQGQGAGKVRGSGAVASHCHYVCLEITCSFMFSASMREAAKSYLLNALIYMQTHFVVLYFISFNLFVKNILKLRFPSWADKHVP